MGQESNLFGTACKTCRRRGRKCDRNLPTCWSCSQRGWKCEGYVLRWVGAAARGTLARQPDTTAAHDMLLDVGKKRGIARQAKSTKSDTATTPSPRSPDHFRHVSLPILSNVPDARSGALSDLRRRNWSILTITGTTGDDLGGFVQYYTLDISAAFYLGQGHAETPCTRHILPMTRSVASVRCAVAATAACHMANRWDNDQLKRQSLHLQLQATQRLRAELDDKPHGPDLACLVCMLLLAQLDVCSGDCIEFGTHLEAASRFIRLRGSDGTKEAYIQQRIAWLDIMGATLSSKMPQWSGKDLKATLDKFTAPSGRREWGFDVFQCPIDLFEYIADITLLRKPQPASSNLGQTGVQKAVMLGHAIKRWESPANSDPRRHFVEVWRLGTLLYLIRLFELADDVFNTTHLIRSFFRHARAIPVRTSWRFATSWPLFQAGLHLTHTDSQTKTWVRNELYINFRTHGCFHQKLAVEALEQVWNSGNNRLCDISDEDFPQRKLIL